MTRPWYEAAFGASYPVVYAHRDAAEAAQAVTLAQRMLGELPGPWLDLGCGQGRHLTGLATAGRTMVGLDLSAELLTLARDEGVCQPLLRADMRQLPLRSETFAGVMSMFTAFGYFGAAAQHRTVVREVARVLRPGGRWLLDFLNADRVAQELAAGPRSRRRRSGPLQVHETRRLADQPRRVVKQVVLASAGPEHDRAAADLGVGHGGLTYDEEVTLFGLDELHAMAAQAGLECLDAAGDYTGAPLDPERSPRWILVYRREHQGKDTE